MRTKTWRFDPINLEWQKYWSWLCYISALFSKFFLTTGKGCKNIYIFMSINIQYICHWLSLRFHFCSFFLSYRSLYSLKEDMAAFKRRHFDLQLTGFRPQSTAFQPVLVLNKSPSWNRLIKKKKKTSKANGNSQGRTLTSTTKAAVHCCHGAGARANELFMLHQQFS